MTSLTARFEDFLRGLPGSESIDDTRKHSEHGVSRADFLLFDRRVVAEIKTLTAAQLRKGAAVMDDYLQDTGAIIFGTLPMSRIARSPEHLASLEQTIYKRMTRGIEKACGNANKQIGAEFSKLPRLATGLLVIVNETLVDMHPRLVADRVLEFTRSKPTNIHYCLLIFDTHKVVINGLLRPYPLLLDLTTSARQRRVKPLLKELQQRWAVEIGYPTGLPSPEPRELDYFPHGVTFGY